MDEVARHHKGIIARLCGCTTRNEAQQHQGRELAIPGSALPEAEEDEYYWFELVGCQVVTCAHTDLGKVQRLMATGANDVLVVRDGKRERLIPFTAQVVQAVDKGSRCITVDWDADF